jgi:hypothetical protein
MPILPTDKESRKKLPMGRGVLDYFPLALAEVSKASLDGNLQHMPDEPLHWDRSKSSDDEDALIRHYIDRYEVDERGVAECGRLAWRALAVAEKILESRRELDKET